MPHLLERLYPSMDRGCFVPPPVAAYGAALYALAAVA